MSLAIDGVTFGGSLRTHELRTETEYGEHPMEAFQTVAIVLFGGTAGWVYLKLKERIEFLEHEVRWLRSELEKMKPTESKSEYD